MIGWDHKVNERDLEALKRVREAGVHVAICTGRNAVESAGVIGALDLKGPGVFVNGAMVCDMGTGKTANARVLSDAMAEEAVDFFGSMGHAVLGLADDAATRLPVYFMTDHAPPHQSTTEWLLVNRMSARICADIPADHRGRIVRLGIVVNVPESAKIEAALDERFGKRGMWNSIYSPHYDCQVIELFAAGTSKWAGIEEVARELGVGAEQVIVVGDDKNDVAMLQGAALSFAMGNAKDEIKKFAKRVTKSQQECGVAWVVEELLSGALEPRKNEK